MTYEEKRNGYGGTARPPSLKRSSWKRSSGTAQTRSISHRCSPLFPAALVTVRHCPALLNALRTLCRQPTHR